MAAVTGKMHIDYILCNTLKLYWCFNLIEISSAWISKHYEIL